MMNLVTFCVVLPALVIKAMGDLMSNDCSNGPVVQVIWNLMVVEDALEDSSWEDHLIFDGVVISVDNGNLGSFNQRQHI